VSTAVDLRDPSTFPSRRAEAWKYTDLRRVLRETPPPSPAVEIAPGGPFAALGGEEIAFANGRAVGADAFVASGERTLRLRFVSDATGTGHSASVRIAVKPGARLTLLESHEGVGAGYVANYRIELDVPAGAEVTRVVLVEEPADAISIATTTVRAAPGAAYRQTTIASGAKLQRQETHLAHGGEATAVTLDGLYALSGERHADLTSVVRHNGLNGATSQLTKGVVRDTARGVFQGKIVVERGADGTDARMGHHALILGERAEVDAKPELEIYADDVQCAHGNTIGNLDESALFYMQQRGIPAEEARALLTQAFLFEVVDRIAHEDAREVVRSWLTERL
jgi:Fe-S cluster assembly protein SufD